MSPMTFPEMIALFAWISALTFPLGPTQRLWSLSWIRPSTRPSMVRPSSTVNSPLMETDCFTLAVRGKYIQLSDPQVEQTRLPEVETDNVRGASQSAHNMIRSSKDLFTLEVEAMAYLFLIVYKSLDVTPNFEQEFIH